MNTLAIRRGLPNPGPSIEPELDKFVVFAGPLSSAEHFNRNLCTNSEFACEYYQTHYFYHCHTHQRECEREEKREIFNDKIVSLIFLRARNGVGMFCASGGENQVATLILTPERKITNIRAVTIYFTSFFLYPNDINWYKKTAHLVL